MKAIAPGMYDRISSPRLSKMGIRLYVRLLLVFSKKFGQPLSGSRLREGGKRKEGEEEGGSVSGHTMKTKGRKGRRREGA